MRFFGSIAFLPLALVSVVSAAPGSVGKALKLNPVKDVSNCFFDCHRMASNTIRLPGRDANFETSIGLNCEYSAWISLVSTCMTTKCVSAPDFGYALEYGAKFCKRAGVEVVFEIPQWFLDSEGGQWYNATIAAASTSTRLVPSTVLAALPLTLLLF